MTAPRTVLLKTTSDGLGSSFAPSLVDALQTLAKDSLRLSLDPEAEADVASLPALGGRIVVIAIGPEGGWSSRDRVALADAGFTGLRLGPRILRTETAGMAAIAALQSRFGDL